MQVTYQLTPDDVHQGFLAWRRRGKWQQWMRWFAYLIVGLAVIISLTLLLVDRSAATTPTASAGITFCVVWFAYMLSAPRLSSRRQFRSNPMVQSAITLEVTEQGLEFQNAHVHSKVAWSAYVAWGEVKTVFVLMPQPRTYITIPKRAFTEEQVSEFRELLRRNIGKR